MKDRIVVKGARQHGLGVIRTADRVIDMDPAAGIVGARVIGRGIPEHAAVGTRSLTGTFLRALLERK